jgi:hypothetical protein
LAEVPIPAGIFSDIVHGEAQPIGQSHGDGVVRRIVRVVVRYVRNRVSRLVINPIWVEVCNLLLNNWLALAKSDCVWKEEEKQRHTSFFIGWAEMCGEEEAGELTGGV